jgi:predicted NAD-dependent protein-ADP-ribosyltransferase YbiA (DUF1768 family)
MENQNFVSGSNRYAFRCGSDVVNGCSLALGNMVSGFPFLLEGVWFQNSECAYIAGEFSGGTPEQQAIQRELAQSDNGFKAKKCLSRPNKHLWRKDWEELRVQWMLYVVWAKCRGNADFRNLLLALPENAEIIEDSTDQTSTTAQFWGTKNAELRRLTRSAKRQLLAQGMTKKAVKAELARLRLTEWRGVGEYVGLNMMGRILKQCQLALLHHTEPEIDYRLLASKRINLLGHILTFEHHCAA